MPFLTKAEFVAFIISDIEGKLVQKLLRMKLAMEKANKEYIINVCGFFIRSFEFLDRK